MALTGGQIRSVYMKISESKNKTADLVLLRHGQSEWNRQNLFTGWVDVDLSKKGKEEAQKAGQFFKKNQISFDMAFCSFLKRAIRTLWIVLDEMDRMWIPVIKSWHLNERHYGGLTGLNKKELIQKYGEDQVHLWRRDYQTKPPDRMELSALLRQKLSFGSGLAQIPAGESLSQTQERVLPFWESDIRPALDKGKKVLVTAHGNSLRALIKHIENISDKDITQREIPTAFPLAYTRYGNSFSPLPLKSSQPD